MVSGKSLTSMCVSGMRSLEALSSVEKGMNPVV